MKLVTAVMLVVLLVGAATAAVVGQDWGRLREISLERTSCFGACPIYKVTFRSDGTVIYHGDRFVDRIGDYRARVPRSEVRKLERALGRLGYWGFKRSYDGNITDQPSQIVTVRTNKFIKTVREYGHFGPDELEKLHDMIDRVMASAKGWRKVSPVKQGER